ncbi:MAG TPA: hypothetical protein VGT44_12950 [Ktedonobacteraceae bacterium]|nr:hypothetical protein [Ktedonobacteraceae bacterium]
MRVLKSRYKGYYFIVVMLLAMTTMGSVIAYADSGTATATVRPGGLTVANASNLVSLSLANKKKVRMVNYSLPITVIDARGSGAGWNLMITSTTFQLVEHDKHASTNQLPANASSVVGVSASCGTNSTCTGPTNGVIYPLLVPAGTTPPPPVKFFDATTQSGLGKFNIVMMVNVTVPASTERGIYTSTLTITIASGP